MVDEVSLEFKIGLLLVVGHLGAAETSSVCLPEGLAVQIMFSGLVGLFACSFLLVYRGTSPHIRIGRWVERLQLSTKAVLVLNSFWRESEPF